MSIFEIMRKNRLIAVVSIHEESHADALSQALLSAGLSCMEVTFRTSAAVAVISHTRNKSPQMSVGAGTILSIEQAKEAAKAGAQFIVSPGFNQRIIEWCQSRDIPVIPGVATPTEMMSALELNLTNLKFFPSELLGGVNYLKTMSGPYPQIKFIPSGGINENNMLEYLKLGNVLAIGGTWFVKSDLISSANFTKITSLAKQAVENIQDL